jgi:hypothetical protein
MSVVVELGALTGFTLDDPVLGLLDTGILDGGVDFVDVSDEVFGVSVKRGRNRDLERTNAGAVGVSFRNESRRFDPRNAASDIVDYIVPRKPVRVFAFGSAVFTGVVDDWNFDYGPGGDSVASLSGADGFAEFARQVNGGASAPEESSGDRIERVLDQVTVNWPSDRRDIQDGNTTLAAGLLEGNALTYLNEVETSEQGLIFMTKMGDVGFRERLFQPTNDAVRFTDDGTGIPFEGIQVAFGTELMANRSEVTSVAGTAVAADATSQVVYGVIERNFNTLLSSVPQLQALADYVVTRYSEPEYRVENITVNLRTVTTEQRDELLALELGDESVVAFTPNGIGDPISLRYRIIGISHDVGVDRHTMSFNFEQLQFQFFVLDDPVFGKLDNTEAVLGF